jgi:hypothetical protein
MMRFHFTISHVPGKDLITADMLSTAPANNPTGEEQARQNEVEAYANAVIECLPATEKQLKRIIQHQQEDETCQYIAEYCSSGWPQKQHQFIRITGYQQRLQWRRVC